MSPHKYLIITGVKCFKCFTDVYYKGTDPLNTRSTKSTKLNDLLFPEIERTTSGESVVLPLEERSLLDQGKALTCKCGCLGVIYDIDGTLNVYCDEPFTVMKYTLQNSNNKSSPSLIFSEVLQDSRSALHVNYFDITSTDISFRDAKASLQFMKPKRSKADESVVQPDAAPVKKTRKAKITNTYNYDQELTKALRRYNKTVANTFDAVLGGIIA